MSGMSSAFVWLRRNFLLLKPFKSFDCFFKNIAQRASYLTQVTLVNLHLKEILSFRFLNQLFSINSFKLSNLLFSSGFFLLHKNLELLCQLFHYLFSSNPAKLPHVSCRRTAKKIFRHWKFPRLFFTFIDWHFWFISTMTFITLHVYKRFACVSFVIESSQGEKGKVSEKTLAHINNCFLNRKGSKKLEFSFIKFQPSLFSTI